MKLFLVWLVLSTSLFLTLVESRNHLLKVIATNRTTLAAPPPTPKILADAANPEPTKRTTLAAPAPSTLSSKGKDSDFSLAGLGKMLEDFLKKLFTAGKSAGVSEAMKTTVQPAGI